MPELPRLSQAIRGLTTLEDTFENTLAQTTGVTPPQGPTKTLVNIMNQIESSAPEGFPIKFPERVDLPNLQLPPFPGVSSGGGAEIDVRADIEDIRSKVEEVKTSISKIEETLNKVSSAQKKLKETKSKVRSKLPERSVGSKETIDF
ncbi:MAG TPA: hypothetical protein EYH53_04490 [Methanothermococcus okinawensis]|nr:hypothetical protein [Methanothermococcus okinawensis]